MYSNAVSLLVTVLISFNSVFGKYITVDEATFTNVRIVGSNMYTVKFNTTIPSTNSLKEVIPKNLPYDTISIINSIIPKLRVNSISNLEKLDELILDNNQLTEIEPGSFQDLPQLRKLVIKNNHLQEIKKGIFNGLPILDLDLSNNGIKEISSDAFDNMVELLNVKLADNQIKKWDKNWFLNTPLLTRLSFQNNLIETLPAHAFQNMKGDKKLGALQLTINIILSHNQIKNIDPAAFQDLNEINNLWLDYNQLEEWDQNILEGIHVKDLRLVENKLTCFSGDLEKILVADSTSINGNPWDCTCLENIEKWAKAHDKSVDSFYARMSCDVERINRKVKDLNTFLKDVKKHNVTEESNL